LIDKSPIQAKVGDILLFELEDVTNPKILCELQQLKASWLPVSSSLPDCRSSSGSYMLSTGVTSRDTHGSLFQNLDGRMFF